jgi:hypothetical protein
VGHLPTNISPVGGLPATDTNHVAHLPTTNSPVGRLPAAVTNPVGHLPTTNSPVGRLPAAGTNSVGRLPATKPSPVGYLPTTKDNPEGGHALKSSHPTVKGEAPLDPETSLPGPGSQRGLGVGGVVGTTTLSGPSPLRGSGVVPEPVHERHEDTQHGEHACHLQEVAFSDEQEEQQRVQARREVLSAVRSVLDRSLTAPTAVMLGARPKEGGGVPGRWPCPAQCPV